MKKILAALVLTGMLATTSCLGPNNLYNSINNWNAEATKMDWLNEIIYLGLWIIPVYPITLIGDSLIFNTIEYWGGNNPITDPGEFPGFGKGASD